MVYLFGDSDDMGIAAFVFSVLSYPIAEKIINTVIGSAGTGSVTGLHLDF